MWLGVGECNNLIAQWLGKNNTNPTTIDKEEMCFTNKSYLVESGSSDRILTTVVPIIFLPYVSSSDEWDMWLFRIISWKFLISEDVHHKYLFTVRCRNSSAHLI